MEVYEVLNKVQSGVQSLTAIKTAHQCLQIGVGDHDFIIGSYSAIKSSRSFAMNDSRYTLALITRNHTEYIPKDRNGENGVVFNYDQVVNASIAVIYGTIEKPNGIKQSTLYTDVANVRDKIINVTGNQYIELKEINEQGYFLEPFGISKEINIYIGFRIDFTITIEFQRS